MSTLSAGGFFHHFRDTGSIDDCHRRHLVSSTRFIFNYAMAAIEFNESAALGHACLDVARRLALVQGDAGRR